MASNANPRSSLEANAHGAPAEARGRVTLVEGDLFRIEHDGIGVCATAHPTPPFGAWVVVRGRWEGSCLKASAIDVVQLPALDLARADSDVGWAQRGGVAALQQRHRIVRAIRGFFDQAEFVEVETPAVVRSPTMELHVDAPAVHSGRDSRWLQISPEHHMKRLLSAGMSRIYQICRTHRTGEHGALHEPEFTTLEWYRAFADFEDVMRDTEALLARVVLEVRGGTHLPSRGDSTVVDVSEPWERLTMREAFARYADRSMDDLLLDEDAFYRTLAEQVQPRLGRVRPTWLTLYPATMASLARLCPDDPSVADRFELYVGGVELCNGSAELTDPIEQRRRFELDRALRARLGRTVYPLDEKFLQALQDGLPPCAGNALGIDRLVMLVLGAEDIASVMAFSYERA